LWVTCSRSCLNWRQQYDRSRQHPQHEVVLLAAAHSSQLAPHAGKHEREDMGRVLQVPAGSCDVGHMWAVQHAAAFQQNMVLVGLPDINTAHAGLRFGCGVLGAGRISSAQSAWVCKCVLSTLEPAVLCWQHLHCRWLRERPAVQALSSSKLFVPLLYYILLLACKVGRSGVCCDNSVDVAFEPLTYRSGAHICVI
jgi:hypothetical protein